MISTSTAMMPARISASPTFDPRQPLDWILDLSERAGFQTIELMSSWAQSAIDLAGKPEDYRQAAARRGLAITSFHMPQITAADPSSLDRALASLRFAQGLGAEVVIYKADSLDSYARCAAPVLDLAGELGLQAIIYNHSGSLISDLDDYDRALQAIDDPRIGALLEVGHFHAAGVAWSDALKALGDRIKLVHFKDMRGKAPVPYGEGEIDLAALFGTLNRAGYSGRLVLELEKVPPTEVESQLMRATAYTRSAWGAAARN